MAPGKQNFFQFYYRTVYRGRHSWKYVLRVYDDPALSICNAGRRSDLIYSIDPGIWRNHWLLDFIFPDPDGKPAKSCSVPCAVPCSSADKKIAAIR